MKRFFLSAFSVVLAIGTVAPKVQAVPQVDPAFNLQTMRLDEFDIRNKAEEDPQPYGWQPSTQPSLRNDTAETESSQTTEPAVWETSENHEEDASPALSVTERRHQVLDRS